MNKNISQTIHKYLKISGKTIATAESCTGGNIAYQLILNSGASVYFKGGIVAYCNEIKHNILQVKKETLDTYGAVSKQTAKEMAEGVLKLYDTDFAIATTGLAGPNTDGSQNEVGTVFIAIACKDKKTVVEKQLFNVERIEFIETTTNYALNFLLQQYFINL